MSSFPLTGSEKGSSGIPESSRFGGAKTASHVWLFGKIYISRGIWEQQKALGTITPSDESVLLRDLRDPRRRQETWISLGAGGCTIFYGMFRARPRWSLFRSTCMTAFMMVLGFSGAVVASDIRAASHLHYCKDPEKVGRAILEMMQEEDRRNRLKHERLRGPRKIERRRSAREEQMKEWRQVESDRTEQQDIESGMVEPTTGTTLEDGQGPEGSPSYDSASQPGSVWDAIRQGHTPAPRRSRERSGHPAPVEDDAQSPDTPVPDTRTKEQRQFDELLEKERHFGEKRNGEDGW